MRRIDSTCRRRPPALGKTGCPSAAWNRCGSRHGRASRRRQPQGSGPREPIGVPRTGDKGNDTRVRRNADPSADGHRPGRERSPAGCGRKATADMVFTNGKIYTVDPRVPLRKLWPSKTENLWRWVQPRILARCGERTRVLILAEPLRCRVSLMITSTRRSPIFSRRVALCFFLRVSPRTDSRSGCRVPEKEPERAVRHRRKVGGGAVSERTPQQRVARFSRQRSSGGTPRRNTPWCSRKYGDAEIRRHH